MRKSLTFHASFDGKSEADHALGDPKVYHGEKEGLRADVTVEKDGKYGDCLRFGKKTQPWVLYKGEKNVAYDPANFRGTVSFWLSLDPQKDLEPGYCDPVSITDKGWNDACFFGEFSKDEVPRDFNLGVFPDNPKDDPFEARPVERRPLIRVPKPPFGRDRWTHVAFTWENFNSGKDDGLCRLYLDGKPAGERKGVQTFTWNPAAVRIEVGLSYIGRFDDLAVFNRALTAEEVAVLGKLEDGVRSLR